LNNQKKCIVFLNKPRYYLHSTFIHAAKSDELNMDHEAKKNQPRIKIEELISNVIENAEARRVSNSELNGISGGATVVVAGGIKPPITTGKIFCPITVGLIAQDPIEKTPPIA
jgi:hypothetical protein